MRIVERLVLAASLVIGTAPAAAAPPEVLILQPNSKWQINYDDYRCELRRVYAAPDGALHVFSLPLEPLTHTAYLRLTSKEKPSARRGGEAALQVDGAAQPERVSYGVWSEGDFRVRQYALNLDRHSLSSAADKISFVSKDQQVEVKADQFAAAWKALGSCMDDLDKELGIDKALTASLARQPQGDILNVVRTPRPKPGGSFEFVALYWVIADGRVDDCRLLKASGDKAFDESFCATMKSKGRFKPAVTRAGQPVRAPRFENVVIRTQVFKVQGP